jgi:two-component system, NtrC family, sensor kinase
MASLGELTAGIAHEIQNPLNFVNNFSEVNKELVDELEKEIDNGNYTDVKSIARDIKDNEEKINFHGQRASSIVKGMLEHSRKSSGEKKLTDINKLCDEYAKLAYQAMRAKHSDFNCDINLDLDPDLPLVSVMSQDISRVILNLVNNALHAINEKSKQNIQGYVPSITVSTKHQKNKIEICVKDNGFGIPDSIKDKIFQPFFTTKPTGQGTGLGLSLSYDIVKAHGGEIKVNSKENEGTEFIVKL